MSVFPTPKFTYAQRVKVIPLEMCLARIIDIHFFPTMIVEYDVRYFHDGRDFKVRVFEDELEPA